MAGDGVLRRLRRRRVDPSSIVGLPDSHPKRGLIAEPVRIASLTNDAPEAVGEEQRITFVVEVRSADDARCPAVAVEARIRGPERERTVSGATDLLGRIRFRMTGPTGEYTIDIVDVAAGGLDWDASASPTTLSVTVA
jgi:hypothetical protein